MPLTVDVLGAAELMKIHPETVKKKILAGEIRAAQVGRAYVMMTKDVLEHIEDSIIKQTAARMRKHDDGVTKGERPGRSRAGSRTASSSGATCGQ